MNSIQRAILVGSAVASVAVVLTAPQIKILKGMLLTCENEQIATVPAGATAGLQIDTSLDSGGSDPFGLFVPEDTSKPASQALRPPAAKPARGRVVACVADIRTTGTRLVGVLLATGLLFLAVASRDRGESAAANDRGL